MMAAGRRDDMVEYFMTKVTGMPAEAVAPMKASPMWHGLTSMAPTLVYDLTIMGDYSFPARQISGITTRDGGAWMVERVRGGQLRQHKCWLIRCPMRNAARWQVKRTT